MAYLWTKCASMVTSSYGGFFSETICIVKSGTQFYARNWQIIHPDDVDIGSRISVDMPLARRSGDSKVTPYFVLDESSISLPRALRRFRFGAHHTYHPEHHVPDDGPQLQPVLQQHPVVQQQSGLCRDRFPFKFPVSRIIDPTPHTTSPDGEHPSCCTPIPLQLNRDLMRLRSVADSLLPRSGPQRRRGIELVQIPCTNDTLEEK
ncbi:hypothetical protein C8R44DRAFT_732956 [Mycena epipterygia]|nr:hypothetical protein C8R44DRAFT_732956 [Mycena epipterygia]